MLFGTVFTDIGSTDAVFRALWSPILPRCGGTEDWRAATDEAIRLLARGVLCLGPFTGVDFMRKLLSMETKEAAGCDGWSVSELKRLLLSASDRLAEALTAIEEGVQTSPAEAFRA